MSARQPGKVSVQDKIAELSRRITKLEDERCTEARSGQTVRCVKMEPEMGRVWKAMVFLRKVFGR